MCILLFKRQGKKIDKEIYHTCYSNNNDGAGFAYIKNGKLFVVKGFFTFNEFWENFAPIEEYASIIHFRVGTSGYSAGENCHPWRVDRDLVFAHNGIIPIDRHNQSWSDTGNYCEYILKPLTKTYPEWWQQKEFKWIMEAALGTSNKVVLLDKNGHHEIFNEKEGEWNDDVWYSNKTYLYKKTYTWDKCNTNSHYNTPYHDDYGEGTNYKQKTADWEKKINNLIANINVDIIDQKLAEAQQATKLLGNS